MSTECVYIAQLRQWVELDIAGVERLIDAVPAYDPHGVSEFHRIEASSTEAEQESLTVEWKKHRICSQEAKMIAKSIESTCAVNLFYQHDVILGKAHPSALSDDAVDYQCRAEEINKIRCTAYEFFPIVYEKFLDVLSLNCDEAFKYIAATPYHTKLDTDADIRSRLRSFEESSSAVLSPMPSDSSVSPSLDLLPIKQRVSASRHGSAQVRETCEENAEAVMYAENRQKQGASPEEIAGELRGAGGGVAVIGCIMNPKCPDVEKARAHGKYLLKKSSKN